MLTYEQVLAEIEGDFACSFWLKRAAKALDSRDPVDALYDARALVALQEQRLAGLGMPITASAAAADSKERAKRLIAGTS